jgi:hypothetical protein
LKFHRCGWVSRRSGWLQVQLQNWKKHVQLIPKLAAYFLTYILILKKKLPVIYYQVQTTIIS